MLGGATAAALGWGWFEAGWVRLRELELELPGLPPELDGLRIAHLSDFHLGVPSRGTHAVERAVDWTAGRRPDLVAITGDLLTHPRGERRLRELVGRLPAPAFAVLGNHDVAISRDPQARASDLRELEPATLLRDDGVLLELRGKRVWIAGTHPRLIVRGETKLDPNTLARDADLRILLCHYPRVFDRLEPGNFDLVLAGHMHDGQITVPYPGGKLRLAHPGAHYQRGVYRSPAGVLHVSPGLGTTFVPFRFAARPEATELVLRSSM
ncbi:MAG: putative metallophosphoesterase [Actinomycetia bacterium]|nr:putative metallophosphoesterase [Actinomycetes bacterium]